MKVICSAVVISVCGMGCVQNQRPSEPVQDMTLGTVQKEIRTGMSQADVATALGSPNIVTKDSGDNETWIYDKIASQASYSHTKGYGTLILLGFESSAGTMTTSQKTLTVVIKFNQKHTVETVSYNASKF